MTAVVSNTAKFLNLKTPPNTSYVAPNVLLFADISSAAKIFPAPLSTGISPGLWEVFPPGVRQIAGKGCREKSSELKFLNVTTRHRNLYPPQESVLFPGKLTVLANRWSLPTTALPVVVLPQKPPCLWPEAAAQKHRPIDALLLPFLCTHNLRLHRPLFLRKKKPSTESRLRSMILPSIQISWSAVRARSRTPFSFHKPRYLCAQAREAHCCPIGTSHHRAPVVKIQIKVFRIFLGCIGLWPCLVALQGYGISGSTMAHSLSAIPSNFPKA